MIKCFRCGAELSDNAKFCNNCGERVDGKVQCPNCNREITVDSNFCEFCGYVVKKTEIPIFAVRRRKKLSEEGKTLLHNITTLALSVLFFIFSLLPVFKINVSSFLGQNQDVNVYYNISIFQLAGAIPHINSDMTTEEYQQEIIEVIQDEISSTTRNKISQREELNARELKEVSDAFNRCNFVAMSLNHENIEKNFASFIMFLLMTIAVFAATVMPLIFCVYGTVGIIKKKIYKMSNYSFVILLPLCVLLFFLLGKANAYIGVTAFPYLNLFIAFLGVAFTFTYNMITAKRKLDVKGFVKRTVSVALIVLTMLTLSANVLSFRHNYEGTRTHNDGEGFESFIYFTDNLLSDDVQYVTAEESNQIVEYVGDMNKNQRNLYFSMINSLRFVFSEDMNENYNAVLIVSSFVPLLYIGSFAMLLTVFILYLLQIFNNVYKYKFRYALYKLIGLALLVVNIVLIIISALAYNESTAAIEVNSYISITAWPFICLVIFSALSIYTLSNGKDKKIMERNLYKDYIQKQLQSENAQKPEEKAIDNTSTSGETAK